MTQTFFEGDTVELFQDTDFDELATASVIEMIVTKPSGEVDAWDAEQVDPADYTDAKYAALDLTDQDITYTTATADLDEVGTYKIQAHVEWGTDSELHGAVASFRVKAHLLEA